MLKAVSVILKIDNQRIEEEVKKIISSFDKFDVKSCTELGPCDLLILEIGGNPKKEVHLLRSLRDSGWTPTVFLISSRMDPELLIQCRRAGAQKIFVLPFKKGELREALLKIQEGKDERPPGKRSQESRKIIHVMGCKGGVGTTTVALNLASSLAKLDPSRSVVLTDLTLPFGDIPILLNIKASPNWDQLARNMSRIDSDLLKSILFEHPSGFFVLPSPEASGSRMNPEDLEKLLRFMQTGLDVIVVDGGKSFTHASFKLLKMAETILLVTGPNSPCTSNVKRLFSIFANMAPVQSEKVRIVVNRYQKNSSTSLEEFERTLDQKIFWKIPNDFRTATEALNQGKTFAEIASGKAISKSFSKLADLLSAGDKREEGKKAFWGKLTSPHKLPDPGLLLHYKFNSHF